MATTSQPSSFNSTALCSISIAAAVSALAFFSETDFYNTNYGQFGNSFLCILSSTFIVFHFILFSSHCRSKISNVLCGGVFSKYLATPMAFFAICRLHYIPETSFTGLLFVVFLWIDVIAILQIIRPPTDSKLQYWILMAIMTRAISLHQSGFEGSSWSITFLCFVVLYVKFFFEDSVAASSQRSAGGTKKDTETSNEVS